MNAHIMVSMTGMKTVYDHLETNPAIEQILQVKGTDADLSEIVQYMLDGKKAEFTKACEDQRIAIYEGRGIPDQHAVWGVYFPPYYIFADSGLLWR